MNDQRLADVIDFMHLWKGFDGDREVSVILVDELVKEIFWKWIGSEASLVCPSIPVSFTGKNSGFSHL